MGTHKHWKGEGEHSDEEPVKAVEPPVPKAVERVKEWSEEEVVEEVVEAEILVVMDRAEDKIHQVLMIL